MRFSKMHKILEEMLNSIRKKEIKKLEELDESFENLLPLLEERTKLDYEYDNCRQSCVMAIRALEAKKKEIYAMFIKAAEDKFNEISEYYIT
jgi:hypothetical protein